jgi:hypothetical protein
MDFQLVFTMNRHFAIKPKANLMFFKTTKNCVHHKTYS